MGFFSDLRDVGRNLRDLNNATLRPLLNRVNRAGLGQANAEQKWGLNTLAAYGFYGAIALALVLLFGVPIIKKQYAALQGSAPTYTAAPQTPPVAQAPAVVPSAPTTTVHAPAPTPTTTAAAPPALPSETADQLLRRAEHNLYVVSPYAQATTDRQREAIIDQRPPDERAAIRAAQKELAAKLAAAYPVRPVPPLNLPPTNDTYRQAEKRLIQKGYFDAKTEQQREAIIEQLPPDEREVIRQRKAQREAAKQARDDALRAAEPKPNPELFARVVAGLRAHGYFDTGLSRHKQKMMILDLTPQERDAIRAQGRYWQEKGEISKQTYELTTLISDESSLYVQADMQNNLMWKKAN